MSEMDGNETYRSSDIDFTTEFYLIFDLFENTDTGGQRRVADAVI